MEMREFENFDFCDFNFDELEEFDGYTSEDIHTYNELSIVTSSENSGFVGQEVQSSERVKRKRRRKYSEETRKLLLEMHERYKLLRPRILRTDFRRNFANMCVNVFNSGDYSVVMDYISTYCARDVLIQHNDHRPCNGLGLKGMNLALEGQLRLAKYWYTSMTNCPDVVCNMHNAVVKVRSDGTATIKCNFELRGNVVLSVMNASSGNGSPVSCITNRDCSALSCSEEHYQSDPEIAESTERYLQAKRAVQNAASMKRRRARKPKIITETEGNETDLVLEQSDSASGSEQPAAGVSGSARDAQTLPTLRSYVTPTMLVHALNQLNSSSLTPGQADVAIHSLLSKPPSQARQFEPGECGGKFDMQVGEQGQVVVTACCDVMCSYEMEFNAENKVQSLVVHLVK